MRRLSIRLYWMALASNTVALVILLRGTVNPLGRQEQVLAVVLTAVSVACWVMYFGKLNK
jgi:hypothetical protein